MNFASESDRGIVRIQSHHSVADTADRLESMLKTQGIMIFARIDFRADAARTDLTMRAEQLLIFGNPRAGTPLMIAQPTVGIDLPLKALVWQDNHGDSWIAYNDPAYIARRHDLPSTLTASLAAVVPLIERAAGE